ncbi:hypothetical protein BT93_L4382 [Corymbia citriodora subsp. variegata]|uniref:Histone chaperone n=1 Tax=Corymbia citriodora subsp. variegata TaxID=360336 RepID=A0A8T0CFX1_CORYI|nr:hypothetical protein BT93_L4382 [Corymbia citriodora subsp. variegata]
MSAVSLLGVKITNNPAKFTDPYLFEITFECSESLEKDLEWKLIYVGSATSSEYDQELDSLLVGPIPIGINKFMFEAEPPNVSKIPASDIIGVTVILLTCSYDDREFVRVGYYQNTHYLSEDLQNDPPSKPVIEQLERNILDAKPRVTRFAIKWDSQDSAPAEYPPDQPEVDLQDDDGANYGAEEKDMQEALEKELAEEEAKAQTATVGEDKAMANTDEPEEDAASEAGSEDLDEESSEDDEDEEEGEEAEAEGEDVDMADGDAKPAETTATNGHNQEVMAH